MAIAAAAGIMLLTAGVNGAPTWEAIGKFVTAYIVDHIAVQVVFAVLVAIASLGGISVIAGGLLIGRNRVLIGKLIISLGAGMGLVGLVASTLVALMEDPSTIGGFVSVGGAGLILSITARVIAK